MQTPTHKVTIDSAHIAPTAGNDYHFTYNLSIDTPTVSKQIALEGKLSRPPWTTELWIHLREVCTRNEISHLAVLMTQELQANGLAR